METKIINSEDISLTTKEECDTIKSDTFNETLVLAVECENTSMAMRGGSSCDCNGSTTGEENCTCPCDNCNCPCNGDITGGTTGVLPEMQNAEPISLGAVKDVCISCPETEKWLCKKCLHI